MKGRKMMVSDPPSCHLEPLPNPVCSDSLRCEGCPYPAHGFVCWHDEDHCLRTEMEKIAKKEAKRKHERDDQQ